MKTTLASLPPLMTPRFCRPRNNSNKNPVGEIEARKTTRTEEGKGKKAQEKLLDNYLKLPSIFCEPCCCEHSIEMMTRVIRAVLSLLHMPRGRLLSPRNGKRKYLMTQKLLKFNLKSFRSCSHFALGWKLGFLSGFGGTSWKCCCLEDGTTGLERSFALIYPFTPLEQGRELLVASSSMFSGKQQNGFRTTSNGAAMSRRWNLISRSYYENEGREGSDKMKSTLCQEQKAICKRVQVINLSSSRFQRENAERSVEKSFSVSPPPARRCR